MQPVRNIFTFDQTSVISSLLPADQRRLNIQLSLAVGMCEGENFEKIESLLALGANINFINGNNKNLLEIAVNQNNIALVKFLIDRGIIPYKDPLVSLSSYISGALNTNFEIFALIFDWEYEKRERNDDKKVLLRTLFLVLEEIFHEENLIQLESMLKFAQKYSIDLSAINLGKMLNGDKKWIPKLKLLFKYGYDVHAFINKHNHTILSLVLESFNKSLIKLVLDQSDYFPFLFPSICIHYNKEIDDELKELFLSKGVNSLDYVEPEDLKRNILQLSIECSNFHAFLFFNDFIKNHNHTDSFERNSIHTLMLNFYDNNTSGLKDDEIVTIIKLLNQNKVDFNHKDKKGCTPFQYFIIASIKHESINEKILESFLESGVNKNQKSGLGYTLLHLAVSISRIDLIKKLLYLKFPLDIWNNEDENPYDLILKYDLMSKEELDRYLPTNLFLGDYAIDEWKKYFNRMGKIRGLNFSVKNFNGKDFFQFSSNKILFDLFKVELRALHPSLEINEKNQTISFNDPTPFFGKITEAFVKYLEKQYKIALDLNSKSSLIKPVKQEEIKTIKINDLEKKEKEKKENYFKLERNINKKTARSKKEQQIKKKKKNKLISNKNQRDQKNKAKVKTRKAIQGGNRESEDKFYNPIIVPPKSKLEVTKVTAPHVQPTSGKGKIFRSGHFLLKESDFSSAEVPSSKSKKELDPEVKEKIQEAINSLSDISGLVKRYEQLQKSGSELEIKINLKAIGYRLLKLFECLHPTNTLQPFSLAMSNYVTTNADTIMPSPLILDCRNEVRSYFYKNSETFMIKIANLFIIKDLEGKFKKWKNSGISLQLGQLITRDEINLCGLKSPSSQDKEDKEDRFWINALIDECRFINKATKKWILHKSKAEFFLEVDLMSALKKSLSNISKSLSMMSKDRQRELMKHDFVRKMKEWGNQIAHHIPEEGDDFYEVEDFNHSHLYEIALNVKEYKKIVKSFIK